MSYKHLRNNIGSISHGTMRAEDLIPCFIDCLESQKPIKRAHLKLIKEIQETPESDQEEYLEDLFDALQEYCLPYFYFGAHPGDGSDYGFWLSESWDEEFTYEPETHLKVKGLSDVPKGFTGQVAYISDHGNITMYNACRGRLYQVWSIV